MRINNLTIRNIGPFKESEIEFLSDDDNKEFPPVIIITGENGTGKSIILDSIRTLFMGVFENVEREINASDDFLLKSTVTINKTQKIELKSSQKNESRRFDNNHVEFSKLFHSQFDTIYKRDFIFEYWTSKLSNDKFEINNIQILNAKEYLNETLSGIHKNIDVTRTITFLDYLKDSKNSIESEIGDVLFGLLEEIVNDSISNGVLSHVSRINLTPLAKVQGKEISLDKLSSGNLYLIQRYISILKQVYSICINNNIPIKDYKIVEGVILIDEAENHLHPKWQKVFLRNILKLFPRIQIIVTTHSPFIVSSIENAKVFVCVDKIDHSEIIEETDFYANLPIEEILRSPLFNTNSFNDDISELIEKRKKAIKEEKSAVVKEIEEQLLTLNPEYFNYLKLDEVLKNLKK